MSAIVVIVLAALLVMTGCAVPGSGERPLDGSEAARPTQAKKVVAAIQSNPPTISGSQVGVGSGTLQGGDGLEDLLNGGISVINNQGMVVPQLGEQVPTVENGLWKMLPGGSMETTWRIKQGAEWHDGTPLTSKDLLFAIDLGRDKDLPFFTNRAYEMIATAEAPDARTVVVTWKQPYIQADRLFTRRVGSPRPQHIIGPAYEQNKELVPSLPYWNVEHVGAGPYKLRQWVAGSHASLVANDRFVLGRPKVDEIEVRFIPDSNTLAVNLLAGEVEVVLGRNLSLKQAVPLRNQWKDGQIAVGFNNWIATWPQMLNPNPPIMLNVEFRRALYHTMDRPQLVETLQEGMVPVAHTFVSPTEPAYKEIERDIVRYDYDLRRTAQLLEGLGYVRGGDGQFRDASGALLEVEVRTDGGGGDDEQETAALAVNDAFRRAGIISSPLILTQQQRLDRELNSTYPGVRVWRQPNDIWAVDRFSSTAAPTAQSRFNGGNRSRYMNPEFDALLSRYMSTIVERDRVALLGQIVRHSTDQLNVMGMWYNTEPVPIHNRLRNVKPSDVGGSTAAWNAHEWDVA